MSMNHLTEYFSDEYHKEVLRQAALCELCSVSIAYIARIQTEEVPYLLITLLK